MQWRQIEITTARFHGGAARRWRVIYRPRNNHCSGRTTVSRCRTDRLEFTDRTPRRSVHSADAKVNVHRRRVSTWTRVGARAPLRRPRGAVAAGRMHVVPAREVIKESRYAAERAAGNAHAPLGHDPAYNSTATRQRGGVKYAWETGRTRRITWLGRFKDWSNCFCAADLNLFCRSSRPNCISSRYYSQCTERLWWEISLSFQERWGGKLPTFLERMEGMEDILWTRCWKRILNQTNFVDTLTVAVVTGPIILPRLINLRT